MPIQKFRNLDDMRKALWCDTMDENCLRRIAALWSRAARLAPRKYPRGVFKFRSIEEAQAAREQVTAENIRRLRQERLRPTASSQKSEQSDPIKPGA